MDSKTLLNPQVEQGSLRGYWKALHQVVSEISRILWGELGDLVVDGLG